MHSSLRLWILRYVARTTPCRTTEFIGSRTLSDKILERRRRFTSLKKTRCSSDTVQRLLLLLLLKGDSKNLNARVRGATTCAQAGSSVSERVACIQSRRRSWTYYTYIHILYDDNNSTTCVQVVRIRLYAYTRERDNNDMCCIRVNVFVE